MFNRQRREVGIHHQRDESAEAVAGLAGCRVPAAACLLGAGTGQVDQPEEPRPQAPPPQARLRRGGNVAPQRRDHAARRGRPGDRLVEAPGARIAEVGGARLAVVAPERDADLAAVDRVAALDAVAHVTVVAGARNAGTDPVLAQVVTGAGGAVVTRDGAVGVQATAARVAEVGGARVAVVAGERRGAGLAAAHRVAALGAVAHVAVVAPERDAPTGAVLAHVAAGADRAVVTRQGVVDGETPEGDVAQVVGARVGVVAGGRRADPVHCQRYYRRAYRQLAALKRGVRATMRLPGVDRERLLSLLDTITALTDEVKRRAAKP